ncbi:MAG: UDP-N-acetylglucosamine 1-carboxyvinyltransferase [Coriobacteriales bacterium]|nr:UDP-N-acetylglucosamine 1-carboxyvinyltransferase [Coriobacteriales bacterium]
MSEEIFIVESGHKIAGTVKVSGAKNSALKLMAASIMASGQTILHNVPKISDVEVMKQVLAHIGAKVSYQQNDEHTLVIDTSTVDSFETPYELVSKMRASTSILGPLIARFGQAQVAMPGGCNIGARKLDLHFRALEKLGVKTVQELGYINASSPHGLMGAEVVLDFPSVGATENVMTTSVVANGVTTIKNAAREPEIQDIAAFLNEMGANIEGAGTPTITITGVDELHPCEHTTIGDRIEAGTYLCAGALCKGPISVEGINPQYLDKPIKFLQEMGCTITRNSTKINIFRDEKLKAHNISTLPFPGFPTDLQAPFMLLCSVADGDSIITENIFENRLMIAEEFMRLGAHIDIATSKKLQESNVPSANIIDSHQAFVKGNAQLYGVDVRCTDLRGGAALVLAGLVAQGKTKIHDIFHIDRGYENFAQKLTNLGAVIERLSL